MSNTKILPLKDVKFNMCLAETIYSKTGEELFKANFYFTSRDQLEKLQDNGIRAVKIDFDQSLIFDLTPQQMRNKISAVKKEQEDPEKIYNKVVEHIEEGKEVLKQNETFIRDLYDTAKTTKKVVKTEINKQADKILQYIMKNPIVTTALLNLKDVDEHTYIHSTNVAYLTVPLAAALKPKREILQYLAEGSILHDIGKSQLPTSYINKPNKLNNSEKTILQTHSKIGWNLLKKNQIDNPIILDAVLHHHESYDGTGYPDRLMKNNIHKHTVMVSLADYYDACISERAYKNKMLPVEAVREILKESNIKFDRRFVMHFIKIVGVYPVGSLLELSDGRIATVISFAKELPTQPIVKALYHKSSPNIKIPEEIITLIDNKDLYIVDCYDENAEL